MQPYRELPSGDLSAVLLKYGLYPSPPSSGTANGRTFLDSILPLPSEAFPVAANTFLIGAAAIFGRVGGPSGFGGAYRVNESCASGGGVDTLMQKAAVDAYYGTFIQKVAREINIGKVIRPRCPQHMEYKVIISKLREENSDDLLNATRHSVLTVARWPEYPAVIRLKMSTWVIAILLIPKRLLQTIPDIVGPAINLRGKQRRK